jgi:hypothetical protein
MYQRDPQHCRFRAGNTACLGKQHIRCPHIGGHLIRKGHAAHFLRRECLHKGLAQLFIPAGEHAEQGVFIRDPPDGTAQVQCVSAADAAGHNKIDAFVQRQIQRLSGFLFGEDGAEAAADGHTRYIKLLFRHTRRHTGSTHLFVGKKVVVQLRFRQEGDAGIV